MFYCQYCHYWKETKQLSQVACSILAQAMSSAVTWQYISHFTDALFQSLLCFPKWGAHENTRASVYFTSANWRLAGSATFPKTESFSHTGRKCGDFRRVQAPAWGKKKSGSDVLLHLKKHIPVITFLMCRIWSMKGHENTNLDCSLTVCSNQYVGFLKI